MRNPMLDQAFLKQLDLTQNKQLYAKIILLNKNEEPIEEIQGKITGGSINVDGNSAVRRTCSLTLVSEKIDVNNTYWALKNKFKLEIGIENTINSQYPNIIWIKQGLFVFTSLNMNVQSNNFTININGKDKMCLLNGEIGGSLNASIDFGKIEEYSTLNNGEIVRTITDIPIVDIIKNAVHVYAGEPLHNIVLNDIENFGLELLEYRGSDNFYMPRNVLTGEVSNFILNKKQKYYLANGQEVYVDNEENKAAGYKELIYYDRTGLNTHVATKVWTTSGPHDSDEANAYNIIKIQYGETAGYRQTALTYPGELVANVGESLVSILDKIKNMFGDFEYFYDIEGRFIFQKKKTYINTSFNNIVISDNQIYASDSAHTSSTVYSFEDGVLLTAFTNAPQITNIKNDFSIWGKRKGATGAEIPVHMRYAIDFKPTYYRPIRFEFELVELTEDTYIPNMYYTKELDKYLLSTSTQFNKTQTYYKETEQQDLAVEPFTDKDYDWREIIYQMALDYFKYNYKKNDFTQLVAKANPNHYPTGITGYEAYYTDMQGFWRQLYHPGVKSENAEDKYYKLFSRDELYEAARELILDERELIEKQDIAQLIIDYSYENFNIIRNNFIESIDYTVGDIDPDRDISLVIKRCVEYGFTESSKVIKGLLEDRWNKMGGKDAYDYESQIEAEYNANGESSWYKTLVILNNFKIEKVFFKEYENVDLSLELAQAIKEGYSEKSAKIQGLLAFRWKKIQLKYGEDPFNYLDLMENEYIKNGESPLYKAYLLMYDYTNKQNEEYVDENIVIMKEDSSGVIKLNPYLEFLYNARQKKIDNYGPEKSSYIISNEKLIWVIATVFKTFEKTKNDFKSSVEKMLQQQLDKSIYDFSQELIDYIVENYEQRKKFFYVNNKTNKISIEEAHIQYLLEMRQDKLAEIGGSAFYIDNDMLVITLIELFEKKKDSAEFKTEIQNKMNSIHSSLDKTDYDFSAEFIEYIYDEYEKRYSFFELDETTSVINVQDQYLQFLLIMRQQKINENYDDTLVYLSNEKFITMVWNAMEEKNKEDFKSILVTNMDKFWHQHNDSNYDFSAEIIDYIYKNYGKEFFVIDNDTIIIMDQYIEYLLASRQDKIDNTKITTKYLRNTEFVQCIVEVLDVAENANDFKEQIKIKTEKALSEKK